jgi:hypothetical protein
VSAGWEASRLTLTESSFDETPARGRCVITVLTKQGRLYRRSREEHVQRGYRREEVDGALERAGFDFTRYDGRTFRRPRKRSGRLLYACRQR